MEASVCALEKPLLEESVLMDEEVVLYQPCSNLSKKEEGKKEKTYKDKTGGWVMLFSTYLRSCKCQLGQQEGEPQFFPNIMWNGKYRISGLTFCRGEEA